MSRHSRKKLRPIILSCTAVLGLMASITAAPAPPQPPDTKIIAFDLPAQSLEDALRSYGIAADRQVMVATDIVEGKQARALSGRMSADEALGKILEGTGLAWRVTAANVVLVSLPKHIKRSQNDRTSGMRRVAQRVDEVQPQGQTPSGTAADSPIDEMVVVARKRAERLIDVPVSVTSVSAESLANQNAVGLADYYSRIPGLSISNSTSTSGVSLRGITTGGNGTSPTVGVMVDEAPFGATSYLASPQFPDIDPAELERIEVLRGPQGTLYGASSTGGLIKLITRRPSIDTFSSRIETLGNAASGGSEGYALRGALNIPLPSLDAGIRASIGYRKDPAYVDNIHPSASSDDINDSNTLSGRVATYFQPSERTTVDLSALYQRIRTRGTSAIELTPLPSAPLTTYRPLYGDNTINSLLDIGESEHQMFQGRLNYDLGGAEMNWISAFSESDKPVQQDFTSSFGFVLDLVYPGSPAGSTVSLAGRDLTRKFSQELRWNSTGSHRIDWIAGLFYTDEKSFPEQSLVANDASGGLIGVAAAFLSPSTYEERAVFGSLTFHLTDRFDVQAGGRWSRNRQTIAQAAVIDPAAEFLFGPSSIIGSKSSESIKTWQTSLRYKFDRDLMVYTNVASGYRPGGPNPPVLGAPLTFESDSVVSYEVGMKGGLRNHRELTFDLALFQVEWDNIQLLATQASNIGFNTNGGTARSRGLEAAVQFSPWMGMTIAANSAFTDAELTEELAPPPPGGASPIGHPGDALPYGAGFSGNLWGEQRWTVGQDFEMAASLNYSHVGSREGHFASSSAPPARQSRLHLPAYDTLDASLGVEKNRWTVNLFVRNITDERGLLNLTNSTGNSPVVTANYIRPRIFGVGISKVF
jgi:outer membrane receptor protein involved in Fe transport